ncbi:hypothetical protein BDV26DRAFT_267775 [Aspergillus bertholletiae]|uniref:Uncharacterized protein n=1 Tax=Aspergillus bertholletiae TaxID=1226010 RepID=A0A5N7B1M7_9EURO|nr:hypothetical protein BDV26DRAFT_267775 [Aspergillus bertholletiae]
MRSYICGIGQRKRSRSAHCSSVYLPPIPAYLHFHQPTLHKGLRTAILQISHRSAETTKSSKDTQSSPPRSACLLMPNSGYNNQ